MEPRSTFRRVVDSRVLVALFFAISLLIGLAVAKDYGISWDEKAMVALGEEAFEYVHRGQPYPTHPGIRYHGAFLEIALHVLTEALHIEYARYFFMVRHAATYVVFWVGMIALYALALRHFRHRGWALLVVVMMLISPRHFGHAFVNARDIPAMTFFTVKMVTLLHFLEKKTLRSAALHGVTSGMVLALRVGGLFVPIYTVLFLGIETLREHLEGMPTPWKRYCVLLAVYACVFAASTIVLWPLLWEQPVTHFIEAMVNMMTSQQGPGGLFFGKQVGATWAWVPVHFVTKTPLLYVGLFLTGIVYLLREAVRLPRTLLSTHRDLLLFLTWFFIPLFIVIVLRADLFDEWRHLYFIYPAALLLAVHGLRELWRAARRFDSPRLRRVYTAAVCAVPAAGMLSTAAWMVRNHPLEYVYFSIPSRFVEYNFELDYWGLSYRQGFEWILEHDDDPVIPVTVTSSPGWENLNILTREQRRRLVLWKKYPPKYILDNFDWKNYRHTLPESAKVHSITVSGMEVLGIYKNPGWEAPVFDPRDRMEDEAVQMWFDPKNMM